jgi:hypothetical protein
MGRGGQGLGDTIYGRREGGTVESAQRKHRVGAGRKRMNYQVRGLTNGGVYPNFAFRVKRFTGLGGDNSHISMVSIWEMLELGAI